ncbi:uncharacterized protein LOC131162454 isoform X2 [Malania oleifera]|uniref:uncharacterized protein LOC131162454 isoform X2 n=1 Tax=Malania oleifera TaxID=397392 RepID=UPI0025AE8B27|nr:uncharacterized protein LOC131162454 isoform X2 [Malania oleifera]
MATKSFKGASVFMSRNLVPPELFDSLHDALKQNGAEIFFCCDPSRNAPDDYHIISSPDHVKFEDLRAKGPQCVLSCAKERRALPKQGFTCCLAMDGVKVLASGFEMDEKVKIEKLVTAMGGILHAKASLDVSFVIVKNVLAAKYKWALNILKKPIVSISWLNQCWNEHRVVPQESYRVLPFSGLTICVTRIPADERKEMEKIIIQNGGRYSAELTRKCTHLISDAPEGDKYKVAQRWGHIHIVTRKWFDQSISRRACLNEDSYPVQGGLTSSINSVRGSLTAKQSQYKVLGNSQSAASSMATESNWHAVRSTGFVDPDLETTLSQNVSTYSDAPTFIKKDECEVPTFHPKNEMNIGGCVADDSQSEDSDLYLSDCRISLVGFEAAEMRKLVNMVRRGGGSRFMSLSEKLTHIVVGNPSELEKKELRGLAAMGVIHVVRTIWLDDCEREKKEIPVLRRHIAYDLLLPKDPVCFGKGASIGTAVLKEGKSSTVQSCLPTDQSLGSSMSGSGISMEKNSGRKLEINTKRDSRLNNSARYVQQGQSTASDKFKGQHVGQPDSSIQNVNDRKSLSVFKGKLFRFSASFPDDRRAEIVQWVNQGGGLLVNDLVVQNVHFTVECHGATPKFADVSTNVSSHWIRSCLEDGCLLDVGSHILYSPLPCQIPLRGFESLRFCVSQYEEKERLLLRNLCFVLGAKFVEKLTRKVTHLLCKFTSGPKYEAACKWGIKSVTTEWIYECVKQNKIVPLSPFCPKEATGQDQEAGLCTVSQYPTQAARILSSDDPSQLLSQSQNPRSTEPQVIDSRSNSFKEEARRPSSYSKRARLLENDCQKDLLQSGENHCDSLCRMNSTRNSILEDTTKVSPVVPDVASAIEDLLEQTSKIQDLKLPERTRCDKSLSSSDCSILGQDHVEPHPAFVSSNHWQNRTEKKVDLCKPSGDVNAAVYDSFSETQTESQVVGYEEDLSGRQMIIDRVRARSSLT